MFTNKEHCTIWEKTIVSRAPAYLRHEIGAHYAETVQAQKTDNQKTVSHNPCNQKLFIIPAESLSYLPKTDDRIMDGLCTESSPPSAAMTIVSVSDFRYGSACVQHVEVTAE